jgi:hypothetical protein
MPACKKHTEIILRYVSSDIFCPVLFASEKAERSALIVCGIGDFFSRLDVHQAPDDHFHTLQ